MSTFSGQIRDDEVCDKRVELSVHTQMSAMDAVLSNGRGAFCRRAYSYG
ncbi:hypothetical protein [uncultured Granulicatella sp.]|nr:hypothetical protein [uncultured Granulicatella sp.]